MRFYSKLSIVSLIAVTLLIVALFPSVSAAETNLTKLSDSRPNVYPIVSSRISSKFGKRKHPIKKSVRHHEGVDLAAPKGAHVRAVQAGVVVFAGWYKGFGNLVTVMHGEETFSLYGHLSEISTKAGTQIPAGSIIGRVGSTGNSTGNHLHFEWRVKGKAINPLNILPGLGAKPQG